MLLKMGVTVGLAMIFSFMFRAVILGIVQAPLANISPDLVENLQSLGVPDSLTISFKLAFYAGIIFSFPLLLIFLFEFIMPGLTPKERKMLLPAIIVGFGLFLGGVSFAYFLVLPQALAFFYNDALSIGWNPTWTVRDYYSFVTQFLVAFGLAFELPVVVLFFVKIGVLSVDTLRRVRPQALVVILVFAAIITPTTDVLTLLFMGLPMYLLYEISIIVARIVEWRERKEHEKFMTGPVVLTEEEEEARRLEQTHHSHDEKSGTAPHDEDVHPTDEYGHPLDEDGHPMVDEEVNPEGEPEHETDEDPDHPGYDRYGHPIDDDPDHEGYDEEGHPIDPKPDESGEESDAKSESPREPETPGESPKKEKPTGDAGDAGEDPEKPDDPDDPDAKK